MKVLIYIPLTIFLFLFSACSQPEFIEDLPQIVEGKKFSKFSQVINQKAEEKIIDLLIVVDNSTSMSADQEKLSREFSSFVSSISDSDYRIGVITTDTDTLNKEDLEGFYGNLAVVESTGKRYISKSDVDPGVLFADLIKRSETLSCLTSSGHTKIDCVSGFERPLYAIKLAIDKRDTVNSGFFREGADLGVVIITDEDETDFSPGVYYSAEDLLEHFKNKFDDEKKITAFDISIPIGDSICFDAQKEETKFKISVNYGVRVHELTTLTGGFGVNICDPNFSRGLNLISNYVEKNLLPLKIKLPDSIVLESIVLTITTAEGLPFDAKYTVEGNTLKVSPFPPEGSSTRLEYKF